VPPPPWDADENRITRTKDVESGTIYVVGRIDGLSCPAGPDDGGTPMPGLTSYVGVAGVGTDAARLPGHDPRAGIFGYGRQVRLEDIKDGASMTMAVVETAERNGPWTAGGPATVRGLDPARRPYIGRGGQFGGTHRGGAAVLFADGSVRFVRASIRPRTFEALATIAGGERIGGDPGE
jgi:prepilin-type processing-associated H-X9-DG protein